MGYTSQREQLAELNLSSNLSPAKHLNELNEHSSVE